MKADRIEETIEETISEMIDETTTTKAMSTAKTLQHLERFSSRLDSPQPTVGQILTVTKEEHRTRILSLTHTVVNGQTSNPWNWQKVTKSDEIREFKNMIITIN